MIDRFTRSIVRHRGRWTAAVLLVLAGGLGLASRLAPRDVATDFLPRGSGQADSTELAVRRLLGGADRVVVLLESPESLDVSAMAPVVDSLAARLAALPGVRRVDYRLAPRLREFLEHDAPGQVLRFFDTTQLAGLAQRVSRENIRRALLAPGADSARARLAAMFGAVRPDPLGVLAPAAAVLERALGGVRLHLADGFFTLPGERGFLLLIEPERPLGELRTARELVGGVRAVLQEFERQPRFIGPPAVRLLLVGRPVSFLRSLEIIKADGLRVAIASTVTVFLLLLLLFRRPLAPLILVGTVLFGLVMTAAIAYLVFGAVSVIAWVFVGVLVGLGDEFAFYIASHYWITGDPALPRAEALASAIRRPARGLIFSGLAMGAAILSLAVVSYPVMTQLAWLTALGLLLLMAAGFFVLPVALSYTAPGRLPESLWFRGMALLHRASTRPRSVLLGWAILLLGLLAAASAIRFEPHPWKVALRGNPSTAEMERARQTLGVWPSPILMVSAGASPEAALARDREAVTALEPIALRAGIVTIESLSRWLPPLDQQRASLAYLDAHAAEFSPQRFEREFRSALAELPRPDPRLSSWYRPAVSRLLRASGRELTLAQLRNWGLDSLVARHLLQHGAEHLAISYLYLDRFPWAEGVIGRLTETLRLGQGAALTRARFIGDALRGSAHAERLRHDFVVATALALLLVGLLLRLQFRRAGAALLCLLPLLCGVAAALGVMGLLGIELNVLTLSIAPLLVGLSVDDGIHMMERLERGEPALSILQDSGAAMIITTLTTIGGLACLGFARFRGVAELGLVGSLGILVALAASLQLLPVCHAILVRKTAPVHG